MDNQRPGASTRSQKINNVRSFAGACTTDKDTSVVIQHGSSGVVHNNSGTNVAITWYRQNPVTGDVNSSEVAGTTTVNNGASAAFPAEMNAGGHVVPVTDSAQTLHFEIVD